MNGASDHAILLPLSSTMTHPSAGLFLVSLTSNFCCAFQDLVLRPKPRDIKQYKLTSCARRHYHSLRKSSSRDIKSPVYHLYNYWDTLL